MTELQKKIFEVLFTGGHIVKLSFVRYTARDRACNPIVRVGEGTMYEVLKLCKKVRVAKSTTWVLNKSAVLKLHGNDWVKIRYKEVRGTSCIPRKNLEACTLNHEIVYPCYIPESLSSLLN